MRNVIFVAALACLASFRFVGASEIPPIVVDDRGADRYDIGVAPDAQIPDGKADTLVVYTATWCIPCQRAKGKWAILREQGYRVVQIDVDSREADRELSDQEKARFLNHEPQSVPTIFWYNSQTNELVGDGVTGVPSMKSIKERLWKPASSPGWVPELRRSSSAPAVLPPRSDAS